MFIRYNFIFNCSSRSFFIKKIYKPLIEASPRWYLSYFAFLAILNALSRKTLSAIVLLFKSSKSPEATSCWKQALSNFLDKFISNLQFSFHFFILFLFLVNGLQALHLNLACFKWIFIINLSPAKRNLFIISFVYYRFLEERKV